METSKISFAQHCFNGKPPTPPDRPKPNHSNINMQFLLSLQSFDQSRFTRKHSIRPSKVRPHPDPKSNLSLCQNKAKSIKIFGHRPKTIFPILEFQARLISMKEGVGGGEAVHHIHPSFYKPVTVNPTCSQQKSIEIRI